MLEMKNTNETKEGVEKCLDSELWHACAGGMVQMPPLNSKVFYFPQGHAEHTLTTVDFGAFPRFPSMILCRVVSVKFLADPETDEVFAKIRLVPLGKDEQHRFDDDDDDVGILARNNNNNNNGSETGEKPASFAKTLTQSDANNGGGFSVPRYCAETIFPPLNLKANPPVQNVFAKDVHGLTWKFRHIFRGTPRRHLLTTGWSTFVNQKKLVAGDSIVFMKSENGDLSVGIRRAKKNGLGNGGGGNEISSGWSSGVGFPSFLREDARNPTQNNAKEKGKVTPESVLEAILLASSGQPFEVAYYPCASTPEFFVKASSVSSAVRIQWCPGMRFKMAFETEDASRISWFLGTVSSAQVSDPVRWPNSPWRMLQVNWDEPDLLQNVKCVSPWLVELVSNMPVLHISPFSTSRKKLRFTTHHPPDFPLDGPFQIPALSGRPSMGLKSLLCGLSDNINVSAGIQGTRHVAQMGIPLPDFHLSSNNKLQIGNFLPTCNNFMQQQLMDRHRFAHNGTIKNNNNVSRALTPSPLKENGKPQQFVLFGQLIQTEQQMIDDAAAKSFGHENRDVAKSLSDVQISKPGCYNASELGLETGHCKVFLESEDVGRTLDLSVLESYNELYQRLKDMFGIEESEMLGHVLYRDMDGVVKQVGEEPFREFVKTAKRLTIFTKPSSSNGSERKVITGLPTVEHGLDSSNRAGPLGIYV